MQVEVFAVADAATDSQGKLNILGAFDTIWAQMVPAVHPACSIVVRLRFLSTEGSRHRLELRIVDDFNVEVMPPLQVEMNISFPAGLASTAGNFVANVQGLTLARYGRHEVRLSVDGTQVMAIPLLVNLVQASS